MLRFKCEEPKGTIYLDELYPTFILAHNGLKLNHNYAFSNRVYLGDRPYVHSLMACPTKDELISKLVYDLTFIKGNRRFKSDFGIDEASTNGCAEFIVLGQNGEGLVELYNSGKMRSGDAYKSLDLDMSAYDKLILKCTDGGDYIWGDHCAWGEARLEITD